MHYESSAEIAATPEAVWEVLVDAPGYPTWDSGVERVEGEVALGRTLKVYSEVQPGRAFPVKVAELEPASRMTWQGGMPLGLFKGVRTYRLEPAGEGRTRFTMREDYSGPLVPLMRRAMPDLQPSFDKFTSGLKARVEAPSPG